MFLFIFNISGWERVFWFLRAFWRRSRTLSTTFLCSDGQFSGWMRNLCATIFWLSALKYFWSPRWSLRAIQISYAPCLHIYRHRRPPMSASDTWCRWVALIITTTAPVTSNGWRGSRRYQAVDPLLASPAVRSEFSGNAFVNHWSLSRGTQLFAQRSPRTGTRMVYHRWSVKAAVKLILSRKRLDRPCIWLIRHCQNRQSTQMEFAAQRCRFVNFPLLQASLASEWSYFRS